MNDDLSSENEGLPGGFKMDAFIPIVLLAVTLIVLLAWQVKETHSQGTYLENLITRQEPQVDQSTQIQATVTKLVRDLIQAAQTDDSAKAIIAKYKIQEAAPEATPGP
jgi:hypothetical protein